jgi:hypothetical protein
MAFNLNITSNLPIKFLNILQNSLAAENLAMGTEERQYTIAAAQKAIDQVIATWQRDYSNVSYWG